MKARFLRGSCLLAALLLAASACASPPAEAPPGFLVEAIPSEADLLFVSLRPVLGTPACREPAARGVREALSDPECLAEIYDPELGLLAAPRQVFAYDLESGRAWQLASLPCDFSGVRAASPTRILALGACADSDGDGLISSADRPEIYLLDLGAESLECLSCGLGLAAINNLDYSPVRELMLFSAQPADEFHNYLYTLGWEGELTRLTADGDYMDFDASWSEDGERIVLSRLPQPYFQVPSGIWIMDADGGGLEQLTAGGPNPAGEGPQGVYPIGLDADPDLSPDGRQAAFSRLRSGLENAPFGVYQLVVLDLESGEESVLDDGYANMVPEWKAGGLLLIRQIGAADWRDRKQSIYLYHEGEYRNLEPGYDTFPIGSSGASWIDYGENPAP